MRSCLKPTKQRCLSLEDQYHIWLMKWHPRCHANSLGQPLTLFWSQPPLRKGRKKGSHHLKEKVHIVSTSEFLDERHTWKSYLSHCLLQITIKTVLIVFNICTCWVEHFLMVLAQNFHPAPTPFLKLTNMPQQWEISALSLSWACFVKTIKSVKNDK